MQTNLSIDTTNRSPEAIVVPLKRLIGRTRPSIVIIDGVPGTGKTTIAELLREASSRSGLVIGTVCADDEKETSYGHNKRAGLDTEKPRMAALALGHLQYPDGFRFTAPVFDHGLGRPNRLKDYQIPGKGRGVLIVEGVGAMRILDHLSTWQIPSDRLVVCRLTTDAPNCFKRRMVRGRTRFPALNSVQLADTLRRHDRSNFGYAADLNRLSRSTGFVKDSLKNAG